MDVAFIPGFFMVKYTFFYTKINVALPIPPAPVPRYSGIRNFSGHAREPRIYIRSVGNIRGFKETNGIENIQRVLRKRSVIFFVTNFGLTLSEESRTFTFVVSNDHSRCL